MKSHLVVYTSDVHGNEIQYGKLVAYSKQVHADSIIIGGDIAPKDSVKNFIGNQHVFLEYRLPELLSHKEKKANAFLIMGNDDCMVNEGILQDNESYQVIHNKRVTLTEDFDIVGYSNVPITPFRLKDWEKFDLSDVPEYLASEYKLRKKTNYRMDGFKSAKLGSIFEWKEFSFKQEEEKLDSIQKDLSQDMFRKGAEKTIYVMHTPPSQTNLDIIMNVSHVGSMSVRLFIEECKPYLTLHGHIHETVHMSGDFRSHIGETLSLASGNHNVGTDLAVVIFDVYQPHLAERHII